MTATWFVLLQRYRGVNRGLTLSFLLGALRQPCGETRDADTSQAELRTLLAAMRDDSDPPYQVEISACPNNHQPIAMLVYGAPAGLVRVESLAHPDRALYVSPDYCPDPDQGLESVAATMWNLHGRAISDGRFSYQHATRTYEPFSQPELDMIQEALASEEGEA